MKLYNNFAIWVAALVTAWFFGLVPFSPLFLVVTNVIWSTFFIAREYDMRLNWIALLLILVHAKPVYFFRHHDLDIPESLLFFLVYNAFLLLQGTNIVKEYSQKYDEPPNTIKTIINQL